jgi:hypothetical protein
MFHLMPCRNPCRLYIHLAFTYSIGALERSVKRTWTSSTFFTNESAWSMMVTGSQSHVWRGPKAFKTISDCFRRIYKVYHKVIKNHWKITTSIRVDLETLGFWLVLPKNLAGHCPEAQTSSVKLVKGFVNRDLGDAWGMFFSKLMTSVNSHSFLKNKIK